MKVVREGPYRLRIEPEGEMRVPGVVFASRALQPDPSADESLLQVANVAALPGIVVASYAMPDVHWGYGFPIGGVAATDISAGGVVSPGGVGFDISCGVRLLAAGLDREAIAARMDRLMDHLDHTIPRGPGRGAVWHLADRSQLEPVLAEGPRFAVKRGHGTVHDLERCEDGGAVAGADATAVSARAEARGLGQLGSLGSGNHFLEVQAVEKIYDDAVAKTFGLQPGQVCVMIHSGSRGLGHQICTDHVRIMQTAMPHYGISMPDRQLACVPVGSPEGGAYLDAMAAAANYGRANRHMLGEAARRAFAAVYGTGLDLVYDVSHNLAKIETHEVDGAPQRLCVHRKGATRALPPGHPELPPDLTDAGQPVIIPGTMGTASYILTGDPGNRAFHSTCHGAGRVQSRHQAARTVRGKDWRGLAEEAPTAYKDIGAVIAATEGAGLCRKIARLLPLGVIKG